MGDDAVAEAVAEAIETSKVAPINAPQTKKAVAIPPQVVQEVIEILTTELPMKRVRTVVQLLEQCPIMDVGQAR